MSSSFFIVGGTIFAIYMYLTVWNINRSAKQSKRENYSNLGSEGCEAPETMQKTVEVTQKIDKVVQESNEV